jgi:hypothetical protein
MRFFSATFAIVALLPTKPTTDLTLSFIEYRVLREAGQIRVTTGFVHEPETERRMLADLASLDRQGIIVIAGNSPRRINRHETIGSHSIETTLSVYPAVGHGYRGGLATADIVVTVDGKKRIDCDYDRGPVELANIDILPVEGIIRVAGSYNDKHVEGTISLTGSEIVDTPWLESRVDKSLPVDIGSMIVERDPVEALLRENQWFEFQIPFRLENHSRVLLGLPGCRVPNGPAVETLIGSSWRRWDQEYDLCDSAPTYVAANSTRVDTLRITGCYHRGPCSPEWVGDSAVSMRLVYRVFPVSKAVKLSSDLSRRPSIDLPSKPFKVILRYHPCNRGSSAKGLLC